MSAGVEHGEEGVSDGAFQRASREATVSFHVADFGFYGASAAKVGDQFWCKAASRAADHDAGFHLAMAAIAAVDDGQVGALVGQDFHLFQRVPQGVAIVGVARIATHAENEVLVQRRGHAGHYDDFEVDRVVRIELDPKGTHGDLVAAISPVADRLLKAYRAAQDRLKVAHDGGDDKPAKDAQDTLNALLLFRNDMGAFLRLYSFLSQIFDYGNTAIEARSIFFRRLIPLLEFGRERNALDVSKIVLTHHKLSSQGQRPLPLGGEAEPLKPLTATGSGALHEKEKALLADILAKLNDLFQGDVTDGDQLSFVAALNGKVQESETLVQQATHNSKEQFSNSPALTQAILDAIIDAFEAHSTMSKQALDSSQVRAGLKDVLLGPGQLYEALRRKGGEGVQA